MISFFSDLLNFFKFKKNEKKYKFCIFTENDYLLNYLLEVIKKKNKKKTVIVSLNKITEKENLPNLIVFKTNFFRELFFLTLKIKFFYCSTPCLGNSFFKKSKFSNTVYIYLQHSNIGLNMAYEEEAFYKFDIIQVVNKFQFKDATEIKKKLNLKFRIVRTKYYFLNQFKKNIINKEGNYCLIAPTWGTNFYSSGILEKLHNFFTIKKIPYKFRPHPMSVKNKDLNVEELKKKNYSIDYNQNISFNQINHLITDWSGIFIEYCLLKKRKALLFDTEAKIRNFNFQKFNSIPAEIACRENMGYILQEKEIEKLTDFFEEEKYQLQEDDVIFIKNSFY